MNISTYAMIIWITAIFIVSLDVVIIIGSNKLSSRLFALLSFLTAIWASSQGFFITFTNLEIATLLVKLQYVLGICIAVGFYNFSTVYPYDQKISRKSLITSVLIVFIFIYLYFFTGLVISSVYEIVGISRWAWNFGRLHLLFDFTFYLLWIVSLYRIYKNYRSETGPLRSNLRNMFMALLLGIIPPSVANILLPSLGMYDLNWFGPITSFVWIFIVGYSIIRYRQMNVKTVLVEVLAIAIALTFFINIFANVSANILVRLIIFGIFLILTVYLIYVSLKEARQREQLSFLNLQLSEKVVEQTQEIKKSYELEKKARRDLEKLNETKDQFIMITQHNIRTPITNIRLELEMLLSNPVTKKDDELGERLKNIALSTSHLNQIVDDFLNISTLKVGSQILKLSKESFKPLLENILEELKIEIESMRLRIDYSADFQNWPPIKIDRSKMYEVLLIILENAVRYNKEDGIIRITNSTSNNKFIITIENTGVGITNTEALNLFNKLFYRSERAQLKNPIGMGIGLSVAKAIVNAHHGDIAITSEGENMGARVTLNLPFDFVGEIERELIL